MSQEPESPEIPARPTPSRSRRSLRRRLVEGTLEGWERALEIPVLWGALFVLTGAWLLVPELPSFSSQIEAKSIAPRDYMATRDLFIPDKEATQERKRRAREEVLPVYDFDTAEITVKDAEIGRLFEEGRRFLARERPESGNASNAGNASDSSDALDAESSLRLAQRFLERRSGESPAPSLQLTPPQVAALVRQRFSPDLEDRLKSLVRQVLGRGVVSNKTVLLRNQVEGITRRNLVTQTEGQVLDLYSYLGYPDELREFLESEVRDWPGMSASSRRALVELLIANLQPNLNFNQSETLDRRDLKAAEVEDVLLQVRKGQVVVRKGDEVSPFQAEVLTEMAGPAGRGRIVLPLLGHLSLLSLVAAALWLGLRGVRVAHHSRKRLTSEALILLLVSLLGVQINLVVAQALAGAFQEPPFNEAAAWIWAIPFAVVAMLSTLLCGRNAGLIIGLLFSIVAARLAGPFPQVLSYSLAGSLAAVFATDRFELKQRLGLARIGFVVGLVNVLMILILRVVAVEVELGPAQIGFEILCGFIGGLLAAAVASFVLPILEALFGITTDIKLLELANTNLPLLRQLAFEAPGTFQHSLMVANLAKAGCEAIGADAALAFTGGLYHDVGKILRPEYFIENQRSEVNPHDGLQPSMSVLILVSHIKDGVDLARFHHLPQPIIDAIEQHHGTRKMTFFYNRALERCDPDTGEVSEEKYRYPGPRPRDKVMGVLMLADGVEAASRTLIDPNPTKIRSLIRTLVEDCLEDHQLDHTDLTLSDIRKVSEAFLRILANLHHHRVDYPGFDFNRLPEPEPGPETEPFEAVKAS